MNGNCREVTEVCAELTRWMAGQPSVGEESLTDWLLYDLSRRVPRVAYQKFTRWDEGTRTGADWEWWLWFDAFALGVRVQAKRLAASDNYAGIAYSNRTGMQIDLLRDDARQEGLLAAYCFYTSSTLPSKCGKAPSPGQGAYMADADDIFNAVIAPGRRRVTPSDVLAETTPLSCWFCCPLMAHADGGRTVPFFDRYHQRFAEAWPERGFREVPPEYALRLLEAPSVDLERDNRSNLGYEGSAGALLVVDLRGTFG